jgi:DNA-binding response OmpR family regulator
MLGVTTIHNIVVIDADHDDRRRIVAGLRERGYGATGAATGLAGVEQALEEPCNAVVAVLPLADMAPDQFLSMIRAVGDLAVLVVSPDGGSVVPVLEAGADDAVVGKPELSEIDARIRAVLRRAHQTTGAEALWIGDLHIDPAGREVRIGGRALELSRKEFDLLYALARRLGRVVSKRELMAEVWDQPYGGPDKTVDVHLSWLRRKLGESGEQPRYLKTVRGVGVKLVDPEV